MEGEDDIGDPREFEADLEAAKRGDWEAIGIDPPPDPQEEGAVASVAQGFERVGVEDLLPVHEMKDPGARNPRNA